MVFPPPPPGVMTGQRMLYNFVKHGKRLVWGTLHPYDLACGFAQWNPSMGGTGSVEEVTKYARDPMNQFFVKLVRERGVREARGITDGLSRLGEYLVTIPAYHGPVILADPLDRNIGRVQNVLTGEKITARTRRGGLPTLELKGGSAYRIVG